MQQFLKMKHNLWTKFTLSSNQNDCKSRLSDLDGAAIVDDIKKMFHNDCNVRNRHSIRSSELTVFKIKDNGSEMRLQPDKSLKPFFLPSDSDKTDDLGAGQCMNHALLVEIPWMAFNHKCLAVVFLFPWKLSDLNFSNCLFLLLTCQCIMQQHLAVHHLTLPSWKVRTQTTMHCLLLGPKPIPTKSNTVWM